MGRRRRTAEPRWESTPRAQGGGRGLTRSERAGRCRECGEQVRPPKKAWCSQACVDAYLLRKDGTHIRRLVFERDHGICARCGLDTTEVEALVRGALKRARVEWGAWIQVRTGGRYRRPWRGAPGWDEIRARHVASTLAQYGMGAYAHRRRFWDADHDVPVSEGGQALGLQNLVTLCVRCHAYKTANQTRRRAGPGPRRIPRRPDERCERAGCLSGSRCDPCRRYLARALGR